MEAELTTMDTNAHNPTPLNKADKNHPYKKLMTQKLPLPIFDILASTKKI